MPLVSIVRELHAAQAGGYALPLFLAPEGLAAEGIVAALEERRAPAVLGLYGPLIERPGARAHCALLRALCEDARVPVSLMLDHGASAEQCERALEYGFSDVMFDGSALPLEENIAATRRIADAAHAVGAGMEAELGHVGSGAEYDAYGARRVGFTDPCTVARYVEGAGVDMLAVAFGSAHGVYKGEPCLDLDLLREIRACTEVPLVMHGGSGLSDEQFRGAIAAGICKINVFTELAITTGRRIAEHVGAGKATYFSVQEVIRATFRERCSAYLDLFGASGRAH